MSRDPGDLGCLVSPTWKFVKFEFYTKSSWHGIIGKGCWGRMHTVIIYGKLENWKASRTGKVENQKTSRTSGKRRNKKEVK